MKRFLVLSLLFLFLTRNAKGQQAEVLYRTYCGGCHGGRMEGNSGPKLIKETWTHGGTAAAIFKSIKSGIPKTEMKGWATVLKDNQIKTLVNYILSSQKSPPKAARVIPSKIRTESYTLLLEKIDSGHTRTPWAIEFVNSNRALISEKTGKLYWLINGKLDTTSIRGLPLTHTQSSTGGFMDIALHPDYSKNGWVYLSYSFTKGDLLDKNAPGMTKIIRGKIKDYEWTEEQVLFEVPDSLMVTRGDRWGCRFLFDKAGYLYFSIGDMGKAMASQDVKLPTGKVYRIYPDGTIPKDNPFVKTPGALPALFSIGNRNVQGIAQDPVTGIIWATEHGPRGGDELNILKKGTNYGWPLITYGIDYSGKTVSEQTEAKGMEQPVTQWTPSIAVCPIEFVSSPLFPKWKNNLMLGALGFEELRRLVIVNKKVVKQEMILKGYGRVRDIKTSPDGAIYVLLNKPDMILRITPEPAGKR
ncbi:MAG TPA: PQQ-dependent sugar dehydrogenase [Chitinophagaceae bacterium]|nr:PQQ-dependent sugar dehydrogenase [Chitinophagaceae bacterium]